MNNRIKRGSVQSASFFLCLTIAQKAEELAHKNRLETEAKMKQIEDLQKEIDERNDTIKDKENRIHELKKKNQELEKFKFVLDYKNKVEELVCLRWPISAFLAGAQQATGTA